MGAPVWHSPRHGESPRQVSINTCMEMGVHTRGTKSASEHIATKRGRLARCYVCPVVRDRRGRVDLVIGLQIPCNLSRLPVCIHFVPGTQVDIVVVLLRQLAGMILYSLRTTKVI
jgi:hypothetical protein